MIEDSDDTASIAYFELSEFSRQSVLTIENDSPLYNGELKCAASWSDPEEYAIESMSSVNTMGSSMNQYSFSDGNGNGAMTCIVWGDEAPTSVSWSNGNGTTVEAVDGKVTRHIKEQKHDNAEKFQIE